jgi:hypothetical protein
MKSSLCAGCLAGDTTLWAELYSALYKTGMHMEKFAHGQPSGAKESFNRMKRKNFAIVYSNPVTFHGYNLSRLKVFNLSWKFTVFIYKMLIHCLAGSKAKSKTCPAMTNSLRSFQSRGIFYRVVGLRARNIEPTEGLA